MVEAPAAVPWEAVRFPEPTNTSLEPVETCVFPAVLPPVRLPHSRCPGSEWSGVDRKLESWSCRTYPSAGVSHFPSMAVCTPPATAPEMVTAFPA